MRKHRHSILVVDDDGGERDALSARLVAAGMDVFCARHGRAALQLMELGVDPCLIVVDVVKPGVAGAELRRALQYDERRRDTPVVVLRPAVDADHVRAVVNGSCTLGGSFRREATHRGRSSGAVRPPSVRHLGMRGWAGC
jgi:CheY-like chemotaxis protein